MENAADVDITTAEEQERIALVEGKPVVELPQDLYIPPDALEIFLETFEGPLDLLLYLIKRQNLDILNIPIASITMQYMEYVELMKSLRLELAAEYLVMAAMLAEIKSRMLLPRTSNDSEEDDDPRAELIRRLQEYERFKKAAEDIKELPLVGREIFITKVEAPAVEIERPLPQVELKEILHAFMEVMQRAKMVAHHKIEREALSVRERMSKVLDTLRADKFTEFGELFDVEEGRMGVVVTLLALLELVRESFVELVQNEPFGNIHVKAIN